MTRIDGAAATVCVGCLDSHKCWVCLGTGNANTQDRLGTCSRCRGSGRCTLCRPAASAEVAEQGGPPVREDYADGAVIPDAPYVAEHLH